MNKCLPSLTKFWVELLIQTTLPNCIKVQVPKVILQQVAVQILFFPQKDELLVMTDQFCKE